MTKSIEAVNVLNNGVKVYELTVENDFSQAQAMLDVNHHTDVIDAESAYNERVENKFVGTYEVKVERKDDYERFIDMVDSEKCFCQNYSKIQNQWYNDLISYDDIQEKTRELRACKCSKCSVKNITIEEWKTGLVVIEEYIKNAYFEGMKNKEMRLNKYLQKQGFSQGLIDFYSMQVKDEKSVFISVLDRVQAVTGMSFYFREGSTNQYGGTSCQDPRQGGEMSVALAGALHDNKAFIVMMHESLEDLGNDLRNMENRLLARSIGRLIEIDRKQYLITTSIYGNSVNQNLFKKAVESLEEMGIYEWHSMRQEEESGDDIIKHSEKANGRYTMYMEEEVNVYETIDEDVTIDCPLCGGDGEYYVHDSNDNRHDISCPMCGGSGNYEVNVYHEIDEYVTIEGEKEIEIYGGGEGYNHFGYKVTIMVNQSKINRDDIKYNR